MPKSIQEHLTSDIKKVKSEGKIRAERIQEIVRDAFSQTMAEFKEGSGEIQATVKQTLSGILKTVNKTGDVRGETTPQATSDSSKFLIVAVLKALRSRLFAGLQNQYVEVKNQAVNLDANLAERYGDRYGAAKQRLEKLASWYGDATAQAKTMETTLLEQRQAEFENKLGEAGTTLAQKERQVKQRIKELVQTATARF